MRLFYNKLSKYVASGDMKRLGYISSGNLSLVWGNSNRDGGKSAPGGLHEAPSKNTLSRSLQFFPSSPNARDEYKFIANTSLSSTAHTSAPIPCFSGTLTTTHEPLYHAKTEEFSTYSGSLRSESSRRSAFSESFLPTKKKRGKRRRRKSVNLLSFSTGIKSSELKKSSSDAEKKDQIHDAGASKRTQRSDYDSNDRLVGLSSRKLEAPHQAALHRGAHRDNISHKKYKRAKKNAYVFYLKEGIGLTATFSILAFVFSVKSLRFYTDWIIGRDVFVAGVNALKTSLNYGLSILLLLLLFLLRSMLSSFLISSKNKKMRTMSTESILKAPISFFEKTSITVILGSLVSDIFLIDTAAPEMTLQLLSYIPEAFGIVIQSSILIHPYAALVIVYFLYCLFVIRRYMRIHSKIVRMDYTNNIKLVTHIANTIDGFTTIRLCSLYSRFEHFNSFLVDTCHKSFYLHMIVKYIFILQSDILICFMIYFAIVISILMNLSYSNVGISMTNLNVLGLCMGIVIRNIFDINFLLKGLFKFKTLCDSIPSEYPEDSPEGANKQYKVVVDPDPQWPQGGSIVFRNVSINYGDDSPTIVRNLNFSIDHAEHFGVFISPGGGKTTISLALLRLIQLEKGQIIIDGIDISTIDIRRVRKSISIIPQDPPLLIGTIRSNLDPYNSVSDDEIWNVLNVVHLADRIKEEALKLDTDVVQHVKYFSQFERQLFFMSRAILFRNNILIFDG